MLTELNALESLNLLGANSIGRIACYAENHVYIVPINYRFSHNYITCYSLEGKKIEMMRLQPHVCFEVDEIIDSNNWCSVIVNGIFEEIREEQDLSELRPFYAEHWFKNKDELPQSQEWELERPSFYANQIFFKILIKEISGRRQEGL
jgi:uncharacterized protein